MQKEVMQLRLAEARTLGNLGILCEMGISLMTATQIASATVQDQSLIQGALLEITKAIGNGDDIYEMFKKHADKGVFSSYVPRLVKWGCINGNLEKVFADLGYMIKVTAEFESKDAPVEKMKALFFYRILAMIKYGVPILEVMSVATSVFPPDIAKRIVAPIREGEMLRDGLMADPEVFSSLDCMLMEGGETMGSLPEIAGVTVQIKEKLLSALLEAKSKDKAVDPVLYESILHFYYWKALLNAGLPVSGSLELLSKYSTTEPKRNLFAALLAEIKKNGLTLSEAMERYPEEFPRFVIEQMKIDEQSGMCELTLANAVKHLQWKLQYA